MATTEWIDIADTAVKIGLGALISGLATYYVTRLKLDTDSNKEKRLIYRNLILEAVNNADDYFHFLSAYYSCLDGIRRGATIIGELEDSDWDGVRESLSEVEKDLIKSRNCIQAAITKLQLLDLSTSVATLKDVQSCETRLRKFFLEETKEVPDIEFLQAWANEYVAHKSKFHELISQDFLKKC